MDRRKAGPSKAPTATAESVAKLGISITVWGNRGVTVETAGIDTGEAPPPWRRAKSMLDNTMAAPPSEVAQISIRRKGSATIGDASTSSALTSLRYRALGLAAPARAFLTLTAAKSVSVAPKSSMRRRA